MYDILVVRRRSSGSNRQYSTLGIAKEISVANQPTVALRCKEKITGKSATLNL